MHPLLMGVLRLIYPMPDIALQREWPLEVLALGISRSGTESLRSALVELGYSDVHHGIRFILSKRETLQWLRLAHAQHIGDPRGLTAADFDKVLGDCAAVTDQPSCGFAHELLTAYPDAKVILNYRDDVDQWHATVRDTLENFDREQGFYAWMLSHFQSDLFWQQHMTTYWLWRRYFARDFAHNGKAWYREHYRSLEERLEKEGRPFLKWKPDEGWKPLCAFLGKRVPFATFPSGKMPKEYAIKLAKISAHRRRQAERNLRIFVGSILALLALLGVYTCILLFLGFVHWRPSKHVEL